MVRWCWSTWHFVAKEEQVLECLECTDTDGLPGGVNTCRVCKYGSTILEYHTRSSLTSTKSVIPACREHVVQYMCLLTVWTISNDRIKLRKSWLYCQSYGTHDLWSMSVSERLLQICICPCISCLYRTRICIEMWVKKKGRYRETASSIRFCLCHSYALRPTRSRILCSKGKIWNVRICTMFGWLLYSSCCESITSVTG